METQLLRDLEIFPTKEVLKQVLGEIFPAFEELEKAFPDLGLTQEWNYYKDGKSWLCKVSNKKKTVFWLSVWEQFFKVSFFFTEKNLEGIAALNIAKQIKDDFATSKPIGRLIPLLINISQKEQLKDVMTIIEYKKGLK